MEGLYFSVHNTEFIFSLCTSSEFYCERGVGQIYFSLFMASYWAGIFETAYGEKSISGIK